MINTMSKIKIKGVTVQLSERFFDNCFEKERKRLEKKHNTSISQVRFTEYLARSGAKFVYPKKPKVKIKKFRNRVRI
jgi:hypothetical protein